MSVNVILTGGFLGIGKTSLLLKASQHLMKHGKKVGLITNDQAPELVDSVLDHFEPRNLTCAELAWKYLQPGYPTPTYRFDKVVNFRSFFS